MHITWDELQTIEALVRLENLEAAARELSLRHSSVSRRIAGLESRLGAALFVRGPRLTPTELARQVAKRAEAMRDVAANIEFALRAHQRRRANRLVITTNDVLAPLLFQALANDAASQARVEVLISDTELSLGAGEVDLALRPSQDPSGVLMGKRLGALRLGVYRAPEAQPGWVMPSASLRARLSMRWWRHVPEDDGAAVTCSSLLGVRDACRAGFGRAVLPCFLAQHDAALRLEHELEGGPPLWLLSSASQKADRQLRAVCNALFATLRTIDGVFHT
ncbi:LysR family transcriptional regulator [Myxococcus virescens]|uniref:LysR family transcriptional regulator n=1 Tax=Myxococcus virescens TaxID=83456 RepID=UPI003DA6559F